ncbi:EAL domain-containing protein [Desulfosporosinus sp. PR]|uniref:EAL domain-containing protein n=1 Tax=Candidatus Desulfosporosinus nitrosoreducens TaxID=3401928 RepID=UPI0027FEE402|nr:EAL domain-containing protein [Desulfosporosinus sp. PR]MDQ7092738.1 EAL domain-containing protein [Desulfosporosinus sp. PR]
MISIYFLFYFAFSIFYALFGIYVIIKDRSSIISKTLSLMCLFLFSWTIGNGLMLIAQNISLANLWRLTAALGWCFFFSIWLDLTFLIKNKEKIKPKFRILLYLPSLLFFIYNLQYKPSFVLYRLNGNWLDRYPIIFQSLFDIYYIVYFICGIWILYRFGKTSQLQREKKQARIIITSSLFTFTLGFITDTFLPIFQQRGLPLDVIIASLGIIGVWYSISKYKLITITPKPKYLFKNISEYLFKIVDDPIFVIGYDLSIIKVNDIVLKILDSNDILGKDFNSFIISEIDVLSDLYKHGTINKAEVSLIGKNNILLECELSGKVIYDEFRDIYGILIILHDISERKKREDTLKKHNYKLKDKVNEKIRELEEESLNRISAENKIRYIAYHDELTKLPNRRYFNEFIYKLIKDLKENGRYECFIIMFLDLDNFKLINDTYGHYNGDSLLCHYANSIKKVVRKNDLVVRIGGDEFLILITDIAEHEKADIIESLSRKVLNVFNEPFIINGKENYLTASIGIARYPTDGRDAGTLIMNADIAMYEAKSAGKNKVKIFSEEMKNKMTSKTILRNSLYKALSKGELSVYYQPQVNINLGKIVGFEALLRWQPNNEDYISPSLFIPLAEDTGLIVPIGYWVIEKACESLKKWNSLDYRQGKYSMAINLSINQLNEGDFISNVAKIIEDSGVNPFLLEFEVTERMILKGNEFAEKNLEKLKKLGVKISIDDFGTEYSSFINIKKFSIDKIKVDMAFIQGLNKNKTDNVIVNSIISLSHNLDLSVIAEGVETEEQLEYLKRYNCDIVQGYLFYKPMPETEIKGILYETMSK